MKIILDCNIWISWLIGHQYNVVRQILLDPRFDIYVCDALLDEIREVVNRGKIRKYVSEAEIKDLFRIIHAFCIFADFEIEAEANVRDPKDLYLFSFAESINANYIVSGDKDLLTIKQYKGTTILKLADFKEVYSQ